MKKFFIAIPWLILAVIIASAVYYRKEPTTMAPPAALGISSLPPGTYKVVRSLERTPLSASENRVSVEVISSHDPGKRIAIFWIQPSNQIDDYTVGKFLRKNADDPGMVELLS